MAHPYYHSLSSAKKFGGQASDYIHLHQFFDQTKAHLADPRHRIILHNTLGIFLLEQVFGPTFIRQSDGKTLPTRLIGEQHIQEDMGHIPTLEQALSDTPITMKLMKNARALSKELRQEDLIPEHIAAYVRMDEAQARPRQRAAPYIPIMSSKATNYAQENE